MTQSFDYVVVGGGSSGCIAAAGLADNPDNAVLLLEAGPAAEEHPETLSANGYKHAFINDELFWDRFSTPQTHSAKNRYFLGTGSVLGGSGSVNGMVYTRGAVQDYDEWPEGWRWNDVVPHFEELEAKLRPNQRPPTQWTQACISAAVTNGFRFSDDFHDGDLSNVIGYEWMNYEGDRRRNSYVAFIQDAPHRPNLQVRTKAKLHRIVFDESKRAVAVEFEHAGSLQRAEVRQEVVMCAGALETPKLLMLSGLGADQALRFAGVPQIAELPGIGQNLHDHPNVPTFFIGRGKVDCMYPQLYSFFRTNEDTTLPQGQSDTCYVFWPAPSAMKQAVQRMLPGMVLPPSLYGGPMKQAVRTAVGAAWANPLVPKMVDHVYGIVVILGKPYSRGSVRLASSDPTAPASYDPAYFSDPRDMDTMVKGVRRARAISKQGGLGAWNSQELMPGFWNRSDEALAKWVAKNAITTYHFAGTCRMGDDEEAVTDTRLRLRGVKGVRIADASAVPVTPVSAMNAPSMLVGLRAAKFIAEERSGGVEAGAAE